MLVSFSRISGKQYEHVHSLEINYKIKDSNGPWTVHIFGAYTTEALLSIDIRQGVEYTVRARYWFDLSYLTPTAQRHVCSVWSAEENHVIIGRATAPAVPTGISATAGIGGIFLEWTAPSVIDFNHVRIW